VYRRFLETGRAPSIVELALHLKAPAPAIEEALEALEAERALVLAPTTTALWMAHPFSAVPTDHRVSSGGRVWWANCAWDAFGVVSLLHRDADIRSRCGCCGDAITLTARDGIVNGEGIIHFAVAPRRFWDNVAYT
jgi:hypothetical protein